jgi:hypothetical protein
MAKAVSARAWGEKLRCVWKLEFQRRGAPHLHMWMLPPRGGTKNGHAFRDWLSLSWAAVVNHPDPTERARHRLAGTGVDYAEGLRARDPKRLAHYFAKHRGAAGGKEYQHKLPMVWQGPGRGPGRFWGFIGLHRACATAGLRKIDFIRARRVLRRWSRSVACYPVTGGYPSAVNPRMTRRTVVRVEQATGRERLRHVNGRRSFLQQGGLRGGFVLVNDGAAFASQLARALEEWND